MADRVERILDLLADEYGRPEWRDGAPPLDELILTILSQNTASVNTKRAFARLRERFPDWDAVRRASVEEIADAIRVGGLADIKAARIKAALEKIYKDRGELELDWLQALDSCQACEYLLKLPGVGQKTAACVLLFSMHRPVLPVDTHVYRLSRRLGLVGPNVNVERAHRVLQDLVPEDRVYEFHINMIRHGRRVCKAGKPKCSRCVLKGDCEYYAGTYAA